MSPLLALLAFQSTPKRPAHPGKRPPRSVVGDLKPVTAEEARAAFAQTCIVLTKVHGQSLGTSTLPSAERPATRTEMVAEMARIYKASEPSFRFTPTPVAYEARLFRINTAQRASLGRLVSMGCVAPVGPLALGSSPGLTPKEFGDALGLFAARLVQMSHLPNPKWTPMLRGDE